MTFVASAYVDVATSPLEQIERLKHHADTYTSRVEAS